MEYCSGQTLKEFLETRGNEVNRALNYRLFKQMLVGVKHIHEKGFIHRDLKPANVFIGEDGNIKVGDFGLARALEQSALENAATLSDNGRRSLGVKERNQVDDTADAKGKNLSRQVGTPFYSAPEQGERDGSNYDRKVDIFSLGLILLEMCNRFGTTQHERLLAFKTIRLERTVPERMAKEFPLESELVVKMTCRDPEERPDAAELLKSECWKEWKATVEPAK